MATGIQEALGTVSTYGLNQNSLEVLPIVQQAT